ncbi:MAG: putative lipopolysaccharide heptosyltransferase III [Magnetococcales bacterium]|nr:putative lipopolysaccharide heptosyltransferase III [Magnetococcales bacterium]
MDSTPHTHHTPQRILVIKSRHIGDVLLTGPLLSTLKTRFPESLITALVKKETAPMLQGHPHLEEVLCFPEPKGAESWTGFLARNLLWWRNLRARRFDWAINTTEGERGIITGFLSGAALRTSFLKPGKNHWWRKRLLTQAVTQRSGRRHAVLRNLDLLEWHHDTGNLYTRVHATFSQEDARMVRECLTANGWDGNRPLVQVHPVARWRFKCWTDSGMAEIIDHLQEKGFAVGVTSSPDPAEMDKVARILALCKHPPIDLRGKLTLKQAAAFAARCRFFFGVDTAMMHVAASLDLPVVALFGPSMAWEWGPWPNDWQGENGTPYPEKNGHQQCGPHRILQKNWPCVPCGRDGCGGSKVSNCLVEIDSGEVIQALERFT